MAMIEEQYLIPYHTDNLPEGRRWMIFSPHADDETFGMGGTLLLAKQQAIETTLVIMTNGRLGIDEQEQQQTTSIRYQEAKTAAQLLGIETIFFLDEDDRSLHINSRTLKKVTELIQQQQPDSIFIPAPFEFHPDHRSTTLLVWQALLNMTFTGALYGYEISTQSPINTLIDISPVAAAKHEVMQVYKSQIQQNNYIEVVQSLDKARTYTLPDEVNFAEGFLKLKLVDSNSPMNQVHQLLALYFPNDIDNQSRLLELQKRNVELENLNHRLLESSSWKITRPLRWLKKLLTR